MRRFALLLLGLAACAELKTAGDEPTRSVEPTAPATKPSARTDDETPEEPASGEDTDGGATTAATKPASAAPDGGVDGGASSGADGGTNENENENENANANANAIKLCHAKCDSEFGCKTGPYSSLEYTACAFGCTQQFGGAAAHYNHGYLEAVITCFATRACDEPTSMCLNLALNSSDSYTRQAIQTCETAANNCAMPALLVDCDKLGHVDLATQNASLACTRRRCEEIQPCLQVVRGE